MVHAITVNNRGAMTSQRAFFIQIPQLALGEMGLLARGKYDGEIRSHFAPLSRFDGCLDASLDCIGLMIGQRLHLVPKGIHFCPSGVWL